MPTEKTTEKKRKFLPAKPSAWLIRAVQEVVRAELSLKNRVHLAPADLDRLRKIPGGAGIALTSNHADETDPRVCIELSRRSGKRFISMCNREAFDENFGLAGWALQRLGHFSVERGAHDARAKDFAIDVLKQGRDVLVIFPEGEIFYLNEVVQPFHTGAIDLSMQALVAGRQLDPGFNSYIVPVALKYHYDSSIESVLGKRIGQLEAHLSLRQGSASLPERLHTIQKTLIAQEEKAHGLGNEVSAEDLQDEIISARRSILSKVQQKYNEPAEPDRRRTIDQAWELGAELRERLAEQTDANQKSAIEKDIATLQEVAQLTSWNPHYYENTTSFDRMAEVVYKLERELYRVKRPRQMATRDVFVKIAEPIELGEFLADYQSDAHAVRSHLTENLQAKIQSLLDEMIARSAKR